MKKVYILSFTAWKRPGEGYRPRMVDHGVNGVFQSRKDAVLFLEEGWPEAVYNPECDDYRFEMGDGYYAVYKICLYPVRHKES